MTTPWAIAWRSSELPPSVLIRAHCPSVCMPAKENLRAPRAWPAAPSALRAKSQLQREPFRAAPVLRASIKTRQGSQRASFAVQVRPASSSHPGGRPPRLCPLSDSGSWQSECTHGISSHSMYRVHLSLSFCRQIFRREWHGQLLRVRSRQICSCSRSQRVQRLCCGPLSRRDRTERVFGMQCRSALSNGGRQCAVA